MDKRKEEVTKKLADSIILDRQNKQHFLLTVNNIKAMQKDVEVISCFKNKLEFEMGNGNITVKNEKGESPSVEDMKGQVAVQEYKLLSAQQRLNFELDNFRHFMRDKGSFDSYAKKVKAHFDELGDWAKEQGIIKKG